MNSRTLAVAAMVLAVSATGVTAQQPKPGVTLKAGDPAPPLLIEEWVKGGPIEKFEKGRIYVMEFWATWCGPCIQAMPHVTELQSKYKEQGVVVIGVDIWERDRSAVEPFVRKQGDKMGYAVAMERVDAGAGPNDGKMSQTWMRAAGQNGIPCTFIIDRDGKIAWVGHPMRMDRPLEQIVAGKFDAAEQAALDQKREAEQAEYYAAFRAKDWDKALSMLDSMAAADPSSAWIRKLNKLEVFAYKGDHAAANTVGKELSEGEKKDDRASMLAVVRIMATSPNAKERDKDLMLSIARRLVEKAEPGDWQPGTVLAQVHALREEYDKAAQVQRGLLEKADARMKPTLERTLREYERKSKANTVQ